MAERSPTCSSAFRLISSLRNNTHYKDEDIEITPSPLGPDVKVRSLKGIEKLLKAYKLDNSIGRSIYLGFKLDTPYGYYNSDFDNKIDNIEEFGNFISDALTIAVNKGEEDNPVERILWKISDKIKFEDSEDTKREDYYPLDRFVDFVKRHKRALGLGLATLSLGLTVGIPSLAKGKLSFDVSYLSKMLSYLPVYNLRLLPYGIPVFGVITKEIPKEREKLIFRIGKYLLLTLGSYTAIDVVSNQLFNYDLPGLVDVGECIYLASSLNIPSNNPESHENPLFQLLNHARKWNWYKAWDLALGVNDLNSLSGLIGQESDLSKLVKYYHKAYQVIPEDIRKFYYVNTPEELERLSWNLINSLYADNRISKDEEEALNRIFSWKRWWIARDIIDSGMVNSKYLREDWDKDGLSNIKEILQGTNPLEDLETNPNNLSERYAIILGTYGSVWNARLVLDTYHILRRNGYQDEKIILFLYIYPTFRSEKIFEDGKWFSWLKGDLIKSYPTEIDYFNDEVTPENFVNALKTLPTDENDVLFIYYAGHGPGPIGSDGPKIMNIIFHSKNYGRIVFVNDSCGAEAFIKNPICLEQRLDENPYKLENIVAIGGCRWNETTGGDFSEFFIRYLEKGSSIQEAFENARDKAIEKYSVHPVIFYLGDQGREWSRYFSLVKYLKRE